MHRRQPFPVCARPDHEMVRAGNPGYGRKHLYSESAFIETKIILFTSQSFKLKLLGLYLDTLIIGHTFGNITKALNDLTLQKGIGTKLCK